MHTVVIRSRRERGHEKTTAFNGCRRYAKDDRGLNLYRRIVATIPAR